jgi:hypothetical protein
MLLHLLAALNALSDLVSMNVLNLACCLRRRTLCRTLAAYRAGRSLEQGRGYSSSVVTVLLRLGCSVWSALSSR